MRHDDPEAELEADRDIEPAIEAQQLASYHSEELSEDSARNLTSDAGSYAGSQLLYPVL